MAFGRQEKSQVQLQSFGGFTERGDWIVSAMPITSTVQDFALKTLTRVRERLIGPADIIDLLRFEGDSVRRCFSDSTIASWVSLPAFWQWPLAFATHPLPSTIRLGGASRAPWLDENAWESLCERAEKLNATPPRAVGVDQAKAAMASLGL